MLPHKGGYWDIKFHIGNQTENILECKMLCTTNLSIKSFVLDSTWRRPLQWERKKKPPVVSRPKSKEKRATRSLRLFQSQGPRRITWRLWVVQRWQLWMGRRTQLSLRFDDSYHVIFKRIMFDRFILGSHKPVYNPLILCITSVCTCSRRGLMPRKARRSPEYRGG